jgi:hypothetical protein
MKYIKNLMDNNNDAEYHPRILKGKHIETRTFVIKKQEDTVKLKISTDEDFINGYGYVNMFLAGNLNNIKSVSVYIGNNVIDKNYPWRFNPHITMYDNIIPAISLYAHELEFVWSDEINDHPLTLVFNVHEITKSQHEFIKFPTFDNYKIKTHDLMN